MKNKYDRDSDSIFKIKCRMCGKSHEILESYAHYFVEYRKLAITTMKAVPVLICPNCGVGELKI